MKNIEVYRMISFFSLLIIFLIFEKVRPSFPKQKYRDHLKINLILFGLSIVVLKIVFPYGLYHLALGINQEGSSLINLYQYQSIWAYLLTIVIFDVAIYWQHRLFHVIPFLWRSHKVHHCDEQMDVTTAVRFHPVEIFLSGLYKFIIMLILGPLAEVYLVYEILLNGFALFTHGNFKIPKQLDSLIRFVFVTPAMHYPHHSPDKKLTNMNYGNIFSVWDRIFKSYTDEENSIFGLDNVSTEQTNSFKEQLMMAFKK